MNSVGIPVSSALYLPEPSGSGPAAPPESSCDSTSGSSRINFGVAVTTPPAAPAFATLSSAEAASSSKPTTQFLLLAKFFEFIDDIVGFPGDGELVCLLKLFDGFFRRLSDLAIFRATIEAEIIQTLLNAGRLVARVEIAKAQRNDFLSVAQDELRTTRVPGNEVL